MLTRPVGLRALVLSATFAVAAALGLVVLCGPAGDAHPLRPGPRAAPQDAARAEICAVAIATLVRGLPAGDDAEDAGDAEVYLAAAIRDSLGGWAEPEVAARAAARAAEISGRAVALARAGSAAGEWSRPPGRILLTVANVRIGPGGRLAWLEMDVTGDDGVTRRLAFTLKHEEAGWVPLEWGPAENEG